MVDSVKAYDLLISCPSDVSHGIPHFFATIEEAVRDFNSLFGREHNVVVRTRIYNKDVCGNYGIAPQELINRQIVFNADMQAAIFWTRFGAPTEGYGSGTEEEIETICENRKPVFLCFLDKPCPPSLIDPEQLARVKKFKEKHRDCAFYYIAKDVDELVERLKKYLQWFIIEKIAELSSSNIIGKQVLWVDDRPENNVYERKALLSQRLGLTFVLSTEQALYALSQSRYDLVISDMARPEGNSAGLDLLSKIRKFKTQNSGVPFLIYCSRITDDMRMNVLNMNGQGIFNDAAELMKNIMKVLKGK